MDEDTWTNDCATPTVLDSSGYANHGRSCPNGTGPVGGAAGRIGKAGNFDGVDDYVSIPYASSLALVGEQTIAAWVKFNTVSAAEQVIFSVGDNGGGSSGFELELGNVLCGGSSANVCLNVDGSGTPLKGLTTLVRGRWYHIAAVWNGAGTRIYVNGALDAANNANSPVANNHTRVIGARQTEASAQGHLNGTIDDVRFYNRALSPEEIARLYNPDAGLVGFWKMDEDSWTVDCFTLSVLDSSGFTNDGQSCPAGSGPTQPAPGKFENGLQLDGITQSVRVADSAVLNPGSNRWSVSAWIKTSHTGSDQAIVSKYANGGRGGYYFSIMPTNVVRFDKIAVAGVSGNTSVVDGQWHLVAATADNSGMKLYVDGQLDATGPDSSNFITTSDSLIIGRDANGGGESPFNGTIDEVRLYNRSLAADEVLQLYNFDESLVGFWKMDENAWVNDCFTPTVTDSSAHLNVGYACPNGTGPVGGATGKFGKAGNFDGVNDYITIPYAPSLVLSGTQTIAAWVKFNTVSAGEQVIFSVGDNDGGSSGFELELGNVLCGGSQAKVCLNLDASSGPLQGSTTLVPGLWYHIAAVWESSGWRIYVNGSLDASNSSAFAPVANGHARTIGARQTENTPQGWLKGTIDEVRVYNRTLSASEVYALYLEGLPGKIYLPSIERN